MKHSFKTKFFKTYFFSLLAFAAITFVSSCKKDTGNDFAGSVSAYVQLVNTSTDAGPSSLYVAGFLRTPTTVNYAAVSGYNQSYVGQQDVTVQSSGGTVLATTANYSIDAANHYTFFLTGVSGSYSIIALHDDISAAASGNAKVRFVQAASAANTIDVFGNDSSLFTSQGFKAATNYVEVASGTYIFTAKNTGSSAVLVTGTSVSLQAGKDYIIYTSGVSGGTGTNALSINVLGVSSI